MEVNHAAKTKSQVEMGGNMGAEMNISDFHFLRPLWLLAFPALALLLLWVRRRHACPTRGWAEVCDPHLLPHILVNSASTQKRWGLRATLTALALFSVALAGPTWERVEQPLFSRTSALVLVLDLSPSMYATDLKPSRLRQARLKIADLLQQRHEGYTALVVFAAQPYSVTPLTDDTRTIAALLDSLDPDIMPVPGSNPALALKKGVQLLRQAGHDRGTLLLLTDEDEPAAYVDAVREIHQSGYRVSVLGVGTTEGAPVPQRGGGFVRDGGGNIVLPALHEEGLQQLAAAGGGEYRRLRLEDSDFSALIPQGEVEDSLNGEQQNPLGQVWRDAGVWLLWPLALLVAFIFRRGWLLCIALLFMLPPGVQAAAGSATRWDSLWHNADQQGAQHFSRENYEAASSTFQDQRWRASALYRQG
ncbi:MAG: VWA domain-containing protein, partial [Desulfuromonas sp.]